MKKNGIIDYMINRDQISNLREIINKSQGKDSGRKETLKEGAAASQNIAVPPGQIRFLHNKLNVQKNESLALNPRVPARTIAITSGKGGVGKTNFVANLGISLARRGKKVLLIDADLGLANIDVLFGIRPKYNLFHVITGQKNISEIIIEGPEGILIVPGGSGITELANLKESERKHFISEMSELEKKVDIILVDTSAGINDNVIYFLKACSEIIVLTIPEPPAMADAYGVIKALSVNDDSLQQIVTLVVNRVSSPAEAKDVYDRLSVVSRRFLNLKIEDGGYIYEDKSVSSSVRAQKPFISAFPYSRAAECIEKIGINLIKDDLKLDFKHPDKMNERFKKGFFSLFHKIGELFD